MTTTEDHIIITMEDLAGELYSLGRRHQRWSSGGERALVVSVGGPSGEVAEILACRERIATRARTQKWRAGGKESQGKGAGRYGGAGTTLQCQYFWYWGNLLVT